MFYAAVRGEATWRAALVIFTQAVEAVVSSPEIAPDFKAGKDL